MARATITTTFDPDGVCQSISARVRVAAIDAPEALAEREIAGKRRERLLYVSAQGVSKVHAEIDALLDERDRTPA